MNNLIFVHILPTLILLIECFFLKFYFNEFTTAATSISLILDHAYFFVFRLF